MSTPLRKSTAGQVVHFTMIDATDFKTPKTGLSIANTDIKLIFEAGTTQTSKNSGGATEIGSTGTYYMTLDATDTATLGRLHIDVQKTGALPYFKDTEVLPALAWDALYAASGGAIMSDLQTVKTQAVSATQALNLDNLNALIQGCSVRWGTAQTSGTSTITLDSGASAVNSFYNGEWVYVTGGTGAGQYGYISGYVGATKIATVKLPFGLTDWASPPDNTSTFVVFNPMRTNLLTIAGNLAKVSTNDSVTYTGGGTVATTTNITGGTITTATNVTNRVTANVDEIAGSSTIDGVSLSSFFTAQLAKIVGKIAVTDNGNGTATLSFKKQDGTTESFNLTFASANGARTATGSVT